MEKIELDFSSVANFDDMQDVLANGLKFPDFYGRNWDAFWDSICCLVEMPAVLGIKGMDHLKNILPEDTEQMLQCFKEYNERTDLPNTEFIITE